MKHLRFKNEKRNIIDIYKYILYLNVCICMYMSIYALNGLPDIANAITYRICRIEPMLLGYIYVEFSSLVAQSGSCEN